MRRAANGSDERPKRKRKVHWRLSRKGAGPSISASRFVATLEMTNREVASDELLYSMGVGSVIEVRDGLITRNQVFPSADEAAAAAGD
jgi:hypothetical protein